MRKNFKNPKILDFSTIFNIFSHIFVANLCLSLAFHTVNLYIWLSLNYNSILKLFLEEETTKFACTWLLIYTVTVTFVDCKLYKLLTERLCLLRTKHGLCFGVLEYMFLLWATFFKPVRRFYPCYIIWVS